MMPTMPGPGVTSGVSVQRQDLHICFRPSKEGKADPQVCDLASLSSPFDGDRFLLHAQYRTRHMNGNWDLVGDLGAERLDHDGVHFSTRIVPLILPLPLLIQDIGVFGWSLERVT
jgi:hypothetical protein